VTPGLVTWVNGTLVPAPQAQVSAHDRAFRSGEGVFETLRAYGDHPFRLREHLARAVRGAADLGYALDADVLGHAVLTTVRANLAPLGGADSAVRLTTSPGAIDPESPFPGAPTGQSTIVVASQSLAIDPSIYTRGVAAITVQLARKLPHVKSVSYLTALTARREARAAGVEEALLTGPDGRILEAAAANVAAVVDGALVTPPVSDGLLPGLTRQVVIDVAHTAGIEVVERTLTRDELLAAEEAMVTASTREVVPLVRVDGLPIGTGRPGPVTASLRAGYRAEVARERVAGG
jgi:branched-subunit amino acid aminotransferase/4-amino-4-deoxychorismate lyase